MADNSALVWFRLDLRLAGNPALDSAIERQHAIIAVFIWAPEEESPWSPDAASPQPWKRTQSVPRYPPPIVDHGVARKRALAAYRAGT